MDEQRASEDDDVDVDHYFLPGGILDTLSQREEDMIGGSLLDEIGGVGNVVSELLNLHFDGIPHPAPSTQHLNDWRHVTAHVSCMRLSFMRIECVMMSEGSMQAR